MNNKKLKKNLFGFSLMEVLISLFVIMVLVLGVYSLVIISLQLTSDNKFYVEAIAIANQKIEQIRNLPYTDVGTITGSPVGIIPEYETVNRDGEFTVHTTIIFYDDPYDGTIGTDLIWTDYKIATVEVSWESQFGEQEVTVFSKVIPNTEETLTGYGLLKIFTVDSAGAPVPFADVHVENTNTSISTDLTSDASGVISYAVPPDLGNYEVTVTKAGYGTDKTYAADATNLNPSKPNLSVFENAKTEESFSIDQLATLNIRTVSNTLSENWKVNSSTDSRDKINVAISADDYDNLYFAWQDKNATSSYVYVQKYDSSLSPPTKSWTNDVKISDTTFQKNPDIVTTASGNSFVVWQDNSTVLEATALAPTQTKYAQKNIFPDFKNYLANIYKTLKEKITTSVFTFRKNFDRLVVWLHRRAEPERAKAATGSITVVGVGTGNTTGNSQNITLDVPSGVQAGDFLLAYIYHDDRSDGPILPPGGLGWNTLDNNIRPSGGWWWQEDSRGAIFWKVAGATEPGNYTFSITGSNEQKAGHIRAYRGVDTTDPFDGSLEVSSTASGNLLRGSPTHTVSSDGSMLICGWGSDTRTLGDNSPTFPAGMNNAVNNFDNYISAAAADMAVGTADSPTGIKNYDANQSVSYYSADWSLVLKPALIPDDVTVSSLGAQTSSFLIPSTDQVVGGAFVLSDATGNHSVLSITLTENGSVDAQNALENVKLYYDLDSAAPYDCADETFNPGTDLQFGLADTFDASDGYITFTEGLGVMISTSQTMCLYVVTDVNSNANKDDTLEIEINNPATDVVLASGSVIPNTSIALAGTTDLLTPADLNQNHYRFRNDDADEISATWIDLYDTPISTKKNEIVRLRFEVSNQGSLTSDPTEYRLEYGQKTTTCSAIASWITVPTDTSRHWKISDSSYLNDADPTTDNTGLPNENSNFIAGETKDTGGQTTAITLNSSDFTEIEYSLKATANATDSSYCFRLTNAGSTTGLSYAIYPEASVIGNYNIYIKSLDANGNTLWATKKVNSVYDADKTNPKIAITENFGNATTTVVWQDSNDDIYAQSFDLNGNKAWGSTEVAIAATAAAETSPVIAIDGNDNIFIAWMEDNPGLGIDADIFVKKLDSGGNELIGATAVTSSSDTDYAPAISIDPNNNVYISWSTDASGIQNSFFAKFDNNLNLSWANNINTEDSAENQSYPQVITDSSNIYTIWADNRSGYNDIYTQKYDLSGTAQWLGDKKLNVVLGTSEQTMPDITFNSSGVAIGAWKDNRNTNFDIYAAKILDPAALVNIGNVPLIVTGTKQIGDDPIIYEYEESHTTDASGQVALTVEWDVPGYSIEIDPVSSLNMVTTDPIQPLGILPAENKTIYIYVE